MSDDVLELPRDDEGWIVGFQVGKAARIADWLAKKERAETDRMINVARASKWNREHPKRRAEINARANAKPATKAKNRARARKKHAEAYRRNPIICRCQECGSVWCKVPWLKGPRPRFCGTRCYQRHRVRETGREPGPRRPKRKPSRGKPLKLRRPYRCSNCNTMGHNRLGCPKPPRRALVG